jgi:hypothetical protein
VSQIATGETRRSQQRLKEVAGFVPKLVVPFLRRLVIATAAAIDTHPDAVTGAGREQAITLPRQAAMWIAWHATGKSMVEIGRAFGNRDHTTVLHAIRVTERRLAENPDDLCALIRGICEMLASMPQKARVPEHQIALLSLPTPRPATARAPAPPSRKADDDLGRAETGSRRWFEENDAKFCAGWAAAHAEAAGGAA